ncbi:serine/threonine-protein phosphatase 6 regulatory ankyrin repeat subunit B-like, partial [Panicum virgatum]|uniref:serine/threonine-protein phosphatase 6 regulatory ankyrin repeat subunit B-like n=1 Tax=Panicum virgatum TaxID=38727 RepID=UPI0019D4F7FD
RWFEGDLSLVVGVGGPQRLAAAPPLAKALPVAVEFGPEKMALSAELLKALTAGDAARLKQLLSGAGRPQAEGQVTINVNGGGASPVAVSPSRAGASRLLGVTSNGNTALHLVASRGHAELAALVCEKEPSLVAARNRSLDTALHCAAKAGHGEVAACLRAQHKYSVWF